VIDVSKCLSIKGAEDAPVNNKPHAFEISTSDRSQPMYFIADTEKEKEEWITSVGRAIVKNSRSRMDEEIHNY